MEWRQQTSVSCADAFTEARRWIEEVTGKSFGCNDFRAALENGVLLCDLINQLKPGIIKRLNRLSTPIAGLDNVNVFLKGCEKLGLNDSQLFHPGDLQDLSTRVTLRRDESSRRLKNVLITIYWLGRKANLDPFYTGPQLNFKAFEGLLGLALSKALEDGSNVLVKDNGHREWQGTEREECQHTTLSYNKENSLDSLESLDSRVLRPNSEGCGSDAEAEQVFKMESTQPSSPQNQGHIPPPPPRRKPAQGEANSGFASPLSRAYQIQVRPERQVQVNPGWIWSKSLSDIPMVYPVRKVSDGNAIYDEGQDTGLASAWNQESKKKCYVAAKDSEAQWQDDFTKWKSRRRSTKGDLRMMSQDREHVINQMTNGAAMTYEKNEVKCGLMKRDQQSPRKHNPASPPSKSLSSDLRPHARALLTRSDATEAPSSPTAPLSHRNSAHTRGSSLGAMPASDGTILGEEPHFASPDSDGSRCATPSSNCPYSSHSQFRAQSSAAAVQPTFTSQISTLITTIKPNETTKSTSNRSTTSLRSNHEKRSVCVDSTVKTFSPDAFDHTETNAVEDSSHQNHPNSQEESKVSCCEPAVVKSKAQQAASTHKYMSRTCSWSGSASLPRGYRRSEGSTRLSSAITARPFVTKQSRMSSLPRLQSVDDNQGLLVNTEREDSSQTNSRLKRQTASVFLRSQYPSSVRQRKAHQARQTSAEQGKEASGAGLSTQASFQTTRSHLVPQPYSSLQLHHNDNSSVPSNESSNSSKVDYSDTRVSLTLKPNSVADFGFQTYWDSTGARVKSVIPGGPAELCRLLVDDEIVAVDGVAVARLNYSQWKDKMASALQTGKLSMDIRRYGNKDWCANEENYQKQPSQSKITLNLNAATPPLKGPSDQHQAARASKCNGLTDTKVQGEVMSGVLSDNPRTARSKDFDSITRKNQKRRAEFFEERGGSESAISDLQVPSLSPSSAGWSWDREEDRRRQEKWQEEQERLLQEQYQRDQERLEAEWQRAQQEAMDVRKTGSTFEVTTDGESHVSAQLHVNGQTVKTREEESPDREELKGAGATSQSDVQEVQSIRIPENEWADASCGFTQLSPAHRTKSLSTSVLADAHKQSRVDLRKNKGQQISKAEQDRQQILQEMKKRTQLLTDNSWIRQRSSSFYKEPVYTGVPLKRYESLDNLDSLRRSPNPNTFSYARPHSAAAGFCPPTRNSCSRYSTGAILSQRNTSTESSHGRMVYGRRTCCVCGRVLGSGAAMVIEALSLCFHLACFQCGGCHRRLGGTQSRVQVRIRNGKPYCEPCYFQLKSTGAFPI